MPYCARQEWRLAIYDPVEKGESGKDQSKEPFCCFERVNRSMFVLRTGYSYRGLMALSFWFYFRSWQDCGAWII